MLFKISHFNFFNSSFDFLSAKHSQCTLFFFCNSNKTDPLSKVHLLYSSFISSQRIASKICDVRISAFFWETKNNSNHQAIVCYHGHIKDGSRNDVEQLIITFNKTIDKIENLIIRFNKYLLSAVLLNNIYYKYQPMVNSLRDFETGSENVRVRPQQSGCAIAERLFIELVRNQSQVVIRISSLNFQH
ncbi:hypothetical protein AGLY_011083 [Aphis glycines]|uniref:Uncharacterized protein n=1 Tax=Aphis glycines TaxID=307491 RepID=A0A6G0TEK7_APHGL|nr:hypothetical protein AGLY_011083 [Aphis glycines]